MFLAIYIDHWIFFDFDDFRLINIQNQLKVQFKMTNLGEISYYSGIEVNV